MLVQVEWSRLGHCVVSAVVHMLDYVVQIWVSIFGLVVRAKGYRYVQSLVVNTKIGVRWSIGLRCCLRLLSRHRYINGIL